LIQEGKLRREKGRGRGKPRGKATKEGGEKKNIRITTPGKGQLHLHGKSLEENPEIGKGKEDTGDVL